MLVYSSRRKMPKEKKSWISYLRDVNHVSHEGKAFQFELRDISLKQHIDLR